MPALATIGARRTTALGVLVLASAALLGCGSDASPAAAADGAGGETDCGAEEVRRPDGRCQRPGLPPDMLCPPGELALDGGGCLPAGVPPEACAVGFVANDARGCDALLPPDTCDPGQMAVPGETVCREVTPCGDGPWGDIPVEASTQFVDQAYLGDDSDGSRERPWRTLQDGVDAAEPGAIVAVAEGRYAEDVLVAFQPVRLWGRCPRRVEIAGASAGAGVATIDIQGERAAGSEVRGLAITGAKMGVIARLTRAVTIDRTWIHDSGSRGVGLEHVQGATVRGSLIERNREVGVFAFGADTAVEASVVRATQLSPRGTLGRGIVVRADGAKRANLVLSGSFIEQNREAGVFVQGADVTIDGSVVRGTETNATGSAGCGICVVPETMTRQRGALTVRRSLVESNHSAGVVAVASDATIEASVVRGTRQSGTMDDGVGVTVQDDPATGGRGGLVLRTSVIEQNQQSGVFVGGSDATIEASVVRATQPLDSGEFGRGVSVQRNPMGGERGKLALRSSLIEQNHEVSVHVSGSEATVEASVVRDTRPEPSGRTARGIIAQSARDAGVRSQLAVRSCLIELSQEEAVSVVDSDAVIETSIVRGTRPWPDGQYGDGLGIFSITEPAVVSLAATEVTDNARAGLLLVGGAGDISGVRSTANRFGLVLQAGARPILGEGNQLTGNTEQDTIRDGALSVPDLVAPVP